VQSLQNNSAATSMCSLALSGHCSNTVDEYQHDPVMRQLYHLSPLLHTSADRSLLALTTVTHTFV